jgi:uncharacterized protein with von Willebrand factor type A (vWA) domain
MKRNKSMVIRLSAAERASLDRVAEAWGAPRADVLRWGLRAILNGNPDFRQVHGQEVPRENF